MMIVMPDKIGLAVSLANLGMSFAPIYWSLFASYIMNPGNEEPTIGVQEGARFLLYFDEDIAMRTTRFFI